MRILKKLRRLGEGKDELALLRERFAQFRDLVEKNNRVLELIADAGEMLGGEYVFDSQYLKTLAANLESAVRSVVFDLNGVTGGRYPALADTLRKIADDVQMILESRVVVPRTDYVIPLERLAEDSTDVAGAKMARLAVMGRRLGCRVPAGFVISTYACQQLLVESGIDAFVERRFAPGENVGEEEFEEIADELTRRVRALRMPRDLRRAITRAANRLGKLSGGATLAVRSSALGEDSELSFAGQFTTILGVMPSGVVDAYKEVVASLYSVRVMQYRMSHGLHPARGLMGVGCLCMVPARAGGVLHSVDPIHPELDVMAVAAARGLGKTVVEGSGPVDRFEVSRRPPHDVVSRTLARKEQMLVPTGANGVELVGVSADEQERPALSEGQLATLAATAVRIEKYMKCAVDVEWAIDDRGGLVILQARPLRISSHAVTLPGDITDQVREAEVLLRDRGAVACNGVGHGRVHLVREDDTLANLPENPVLVARTSSPRLAAVLPGAAAVVTDVGTSTGHLAAIAREFRVPSIVDTGVATEVLSDGEEVTVDAESNVIYRGRVKALLDHQLLRSSVFEESHEYRLLRRMLKKVAPLNLRDPQSRDFAAANCTTYHDIVRFAHEMAVRELGEGYWVEPSTRNRYVRRLELDLPLDLVLIDIGGALEPGLAEQGAVPVEAVHSAPLRSVLAGLTAKGVWITAPARMDANAFMASATRSAPWLGPAATRPGINLAIASSEYLNLSLRLGFHFNIVDAYIGAARNDNYIYFRFTGGVTELTRRSRRAALLRRLLEQHDFLVEAKGDLVVGRIKKISNEAISSRLEMIGRLIGFTRQLDILLDDDAVVERCYQSFMEGRYDLFSGRTSGDDNEEAGMAKQTDVLIIDDEEIVCERLREHLEKEGLAVESFTQSDKGLARAAEKSFDVVVTDLKMKAPDGLDVLHELRTTSPGTQVIIITGYGSIESFNEAQFGGAFEFVPKPFKLEQLAALVKKAGKRAARVKGR